MKGDSSMWQNIAVILIGIIVVAWVAYKVYRLLTRPKPENPCDYCSGCSLHDPKKKTEGKKVDCRNISDRQD